jgi:hypothetical protein
MVFEATRCEALDFEDLVSVVLGLLALFGMVWMEDGVLLQARRLDGQSSGSSLAST